MQGRNCVRDCNSESNMIEQWQVRDIVAYVRAFGSGNIEPRNYSVERGNLVAATLNQVLYTKL
jgi:hypothetical protein